jgi:hypothetical protein
MRSTGALVARCHPIHILVLPYGSVTRMGEHPLAPLEALARWLFKPWGCLGRVHEHGPGERCITLLSMALDGRP